MNQCEIGEVQQLVAIEDLQSNVIFPWQAPTGKCGSVSYLPYLHASGSKSVWSQQTSETIFKVNKEGITVGVHLNFGVGAVCSCGKVEQHK